MALTAPIGLISAAPKESSIILQNLNKGKKDAFYRGEIGGNNVVLAISGIGKTNASHAATLLIEKFSPPLIINFGIGGAYPSSGLAIGDVAIADEEIYGDEGVLLKDGFHRIDLIGIPLLKKGKEKYFNEFPLDRNLIGKAIKYLKLATNVKSGAFVTVSTSTGTDNRAIGLEKEFKAICENMEGAAIAHICTLYNVPFIEIRGISNIVGDRDKRKWNIKSASENCQKTVLKFLKKL